MTTIRKQYLEIRDRLLREGHEPVRVIFSSDGYMKALMEGQHSDNNPFESYMGLPFTVRSDMAGDIGLDYQFESSRRGAVTVKLEFNAQTGHVLVDGKPFGEPIHMMQIIGSQLTAAQLCDLIRAWLDSEDATHWGQFERGLDKVVSDHGRFE